MAIKGDLRYFHPIELFQLIRDNKETGILVVDTGGAYIGVYFVGGKIAFAFRGDRAHDLFTRKVVRDFVVALKTRDAAAISRLTAGIRGTIDELMRSTRGTFSFESADFFVDNEVKDYLISTERIIVSESKKIEDEEVLSRKISSEDMVFRKSRNFRDIISQVQLDADDYRVLDAVDGRRSVREIVEFTGLNPLRVKQSLYGFLCAGIIQRAPQRLRLSELFSVKIIAKLINRLRGL